MIEFVAGFVLWLNAKDPQVYLDTKRYTTYEECRTGGQELFTELKKTMTEKDQLFGECYSFSKETKEEDIKTFFKNKLQPHNNDPEVNNAPSTQKPSKNG